MAGDFDGTDDVIDMGEVTHMNGLSAASWMVWVDLDALTADRHLFGEAGVAFSDTSWNLGFDPDGVLTARTDIYLTSVTDGSAAIAIVESASSAANTTAWQHVMSTYLGADASGLRLYIDGTEDANSPVTTVGFGTIPTVTGGNTIGERHNGAADTDGAMGWVTSWSSTLSATKVAALNRGANPFIMDNANVNACYPMWNTDNLGMDISTNRNDGTVTGVTQATRGPPVEPLENFMC